MSLTSLIQSDTKRQLLELMKRRGEITLDDATDAIDRARPTLRDHLDQMGRDGLVARRSQKQGRGRPCMCYRTTPRAEQLFPRHAGPLFAELLHYLEAQGKEALIGDFFDSFWEARREAVERRLSTSVEAASTHQIVDALEEVLQEGGFMPEVRVQNDRVTIQECNCPFAEVVEATDRPCASEGCFYEALFDQVERTGHMPEGDAACVYRVR